MSWLIKMDAELLKQVLIQGVTFLIYFVVIKKFFYDKINGIIKKRKEMIDSSMSEAKAANEKAQQLEAQYNDRISDIENERVAVMKKAAEDAQAVKNRIIEEAHSQAGDMIAGARREIAAEQVRAEEEFKDSIVDLTIDAAEKVVGKSLDKKEHLELINNSISMFREV